MNLAKRKIPQNSEEWMLDSLHDGLEINPFWLRVMNPRFVFAWSVIRTRHMANFGRPITLTPLTLAYKLAPPDPCLYEKAFRAFAKKGWIKILDDQTWRMRVFPEKVEMAVEALPPLVSNEDRLTGEIQKAKELLRLVGELPPEDDD